MRFIKARYEAGLLKPEKPLALTPGERVTLVVVRHPDPKRWDLDRLAKSGDREERALAEQGLAEWADKLDREDQAEGPRIPLFESDRSDLAERVDEVIEGFGER